MIRMGHLMERIGADCYICDWEHRTDYTMTECAVKICGYDGEEWGEPSDITNRNQNFRGVPE